MNAVGVVQVFKCAEEAGDENWITGFDEARFHPRLDLYHRHANIAPHSFVVTSRAISEVIRTVFYRSAIVSIYALENRQCFFRRLEKWLWKFSGASVSRKIGDEGVMATIVARELVFFE